MATGIETILSSNQFEIVQTKVTIISSDGSSTNYIQEPHGLGYSPIILAFMNQTRVTSGSTTISNAANIPLPTYTRSSTNTGTGIFEFKTYLEAVVDEINVDIILHNALAIPLGPYLIKYYLLRERAN